MTKSESDTHLEITKCPSCNSENYTKAFYKYNYTGKRCHNCDLIYVSPLIPDCESQYAMDTVSSRSDYYLSSWVNDKKTFNERLEILECISNKNSLLDIGCNVGTLMNTAAERGWKDVMGIEPNIDACTICSNNNLYVINSFFSSAESEIFSRTFDAIYAGDVIEHISNPKEFIADIRKILSEDGYVMIVTPDYESIFTRTFQIKPTEHLTYFTEKSLSSLLKVNGFIVELLEKTTRRRTLKAFKYSSTFNNKLVKRGVSILGALRFDIFLNFFLRLFVKDELLVIARKNK